MGLMRTLLEGHVAGFPCWNPICLLISWSTDFPMPPLNGSGAWPCGKGEAQLWFPTD